MADKPQIHDGTWLGLEAALKAALARAEAAETELKFVKERMQKLVSLPASSLGPVSFLLVERDEQIPEHVLRTQAVDVPVDALQIVLDRIRFEVLQRH